MKLQYIFGVFCGLLITGSLNGQANYEPTLHNAQANAVDARYNVFMDPIYGYGGNENTINFASRNFWSEKAGERPYDAQAWFNYYKSTRFIAEGSAGFSELQEDLDSISNHLKKYSSGTWEQLIVEYWNSNRDPLKEPLLQKAYTLKPDDPLTLRFMTGVQYLHNKNALALDYYVKWKATGDAPLSTETYAYNVLQSLPTDAVIFTNGEMDTYPLIYQIQTSGITTVKVISLAWCSRPENRKMLLTNAGLIMPSGITTINSDFIAKVAAANPGKRIYVASTCNSEILTSLSGKLYCTGLAFRYSEAMLEHIDFLRNNVGTKMKLEGVGKMVKSNHYFDQRYAVMLEMNYYLPLLMAADSFAQNGNTDKAKELRAKAKLIRERAGFDEPLRDEGKE